MSEQKLRILFATEYLPPFISGISNRCKGLINGYRALGHTVTVFSVAGSECDVVVPSIANPFYDQQRTFCLPPFSLIMELLDFTKEVKYDIVHIVAPLCFSFPWIIPFLKFRGIKVYVSYHVYLEFYFKHYCTSNQLVFVVANFLLVVLYVLPLLWLADCVGIPSHTADSYIFTHAKQIHYLKSGLDIEVFNPTPKLARYLGSGDLKMDTLESQDFFSASNTHPNHLSDSGLQNIRTLTMENKVMIYVGRLAPEKHVEFLINALSNPKLTKYSLVIVGDGPIREELEKLAIRIVGCDSVYSNKSAIHTIGTKRVIFTGMIQNEHKVALYYSQSDVFVSASESETFGFTVAESMACGTPAVVVRAGAFPLVYEGILDDMFKPHDSEGMCGRIMKICEGVNVDQKRMLARKLGEMYGVSDCVDDFIATYRKLVKNERIDSD